MSATTTYNVETIKRIYESGKPEDVPELVPAIIIAMIKENFGFLQFFNPFELLEMLPIVGRWASGERDCFCGEPDCKMHDLFVTLVACNFDTWQPAVA